MFNLLPDNLKEKIKKEYKTRLLVVVLLFGLFIQILFLVFIFPSWVLSLYREKEDIVQLDKINQSALSKETETVTSVIKSMNIKLDILDKTLKYPEAINLIDIILSKKTPLIRLNNLVYTSSSQSGTTILLRGISDTRDSLVSFEKNLEQSGHFKTVDLPVSNLAKDRDIIFSINLSLGP